MESFSGYFGIICCIGEQYVLFKVKCSSTVVTSV